MAMAGDKVHHSNAAPIPEGGLASGDVINQYTGEKWYYSDIVKDHFFHPRNLQLEDLVPERFDAFGMVGSPACGDMMSMGLKIDPATATIKELKWESAPPRSSPTSSSSFGFTKRSITGKKNPGSRESGRSAGRAIS